MSSPTRWPDALLAGFACSMRTFAGPATLAARGRIGGRARPALFLAAAAELSADKTAGATDRTDLPALGGRIAAGAYTGREIAGPAGLAAAAAGAAIGTYSTWRMRGLATRATGFPDPVVAIGEDLIAYGAAAAATRPDPAPDASPAHGTEAAAPSAAETSQRRSLLRDAAKGLAAGAVGTAVMTIAQGAEFVLTDAEPSSAPADVAGKVSQRVGLGRIKRRHTPAVNQGMHWMFGTSWGVPYGMLAASAETPPELSGPAFGLFVWGAALAHQPALGVADVPWKRSPGSLGSEALFHLVYGIGAGAALRALRRVG